jgi:hypothetical protein
MSSKFCSMNYSAKVDEYTRKCTGLTSILSLSTGVTLVTLK